MYIKLRLTLADQLPAFAQQKLCLPGGCSRDNFAEIAFVCCC